MQFIARRGNTTIRARIEGPPGSRWVKFTTDLGSVRQYVPASLVRRLARAIEAADALEAKLVVPEQPVEIDADDFAREAVALMHGTPETFEERAAKIRQLVAMCRGRIEAGGLTNDENRVLANLEFLESQSVVDGPPLVDGLGPPEPDLGGNVRRVAR